MRISLIALMFAICFSLLGQDTIFQILDPAKDGIMPQFKGGESALYDFIADNLNYPQLAKEKGIQGRVFVTFVVEKDGSVDDVKLILGIGGGCDQEAMRVIKMMDGMWLPGTIKGMPVRVQFNIPIKFTLQGKSVSGDASVSYNKGINLMKEEKYDKALSYFAIYKPGESMYPDAIYASGMCKFMKSDFKGAIEDWEEAKKAGHDDCSQKLSIAYFKLGNIYQEEKKHPIAVSCYSKSLENSPNDVNVLYNRGISYLYIGDKDKACEDWKRVKELGSMDAEALIQEYCE